MVLSSVYCSPNSHPHFSSTLCALVSTSMRPFADSTVPYLSLSFSTPHDASIPTSLPLSFLHLTLPASPPLLSALPYSTTFLPSFLPSFPHKPVSKTYIIKRCLADGIIFNLQIILMSFNQLKHLGKFDSSRWKMILYHIMMFLL